MSQRKSIVSSLDHLARDEIVERRRLMIGSLAAVDGSEKQRVRAVEHGQSMDRSKSGGQAYATRAR